MKKILLAISVVVITGCSSAPPTIQQGPNAEITFDGLHAVENSVFKLAWADPDIDFSKYNQFMAGDTQHRRCLRRASFILTKKTGNS
jgi:hypothetical protein